MAKLSTEERILKDLEKIKKEIRKVPEHFSRQGIMKAFFGALIVGLTFVLKGLLLDVSQRLTSLHLAFIIITTFSILTAEIYFIGYMRVKKTEKEERKFGQFWLKRIAAFYSIALIVSVGLVYLYGINLFLSGGDTARVIIALSLPCAVGASLADLLKKY